MRISEPNCLKPRTTTHGRSPVNYVALALGGGALTTSLVGCAGIGARPFSASNPDVEGIRFYEPTPFLVVTQAKVHVVFVPNPHRGVAVNFYTWLSKQKAELKIEDGSLS